MAAVDGFTGALAAPVTEFIMGAEVITQEAAIQALVKAADFSLKGYGKTFTEASLRTFIEGAFMGLGHGAAETAMDPETWRKGIAEAIAKLTKGTLEAGLEWAIMGVALGGPIALGGKLITRAQVGGMVKRLAAKGISTEGMTPSQIVRRCWAEELKAAGKVAEGEMLEEMVEQEMGAAEAPLEAEIGKDPASVGKKVDAAPATEAGGPERGLPEDRLGPDGWPGLPESELHGRLDAETLILSENHRLIWVRERCYLCSPFCRNVPQIKVKYRAFLLKNSAYVTELDRLATKLDKERMRPQDFSDELNAIETRIINAIENPQPKVVVPKNIAREISFTYHGDLGEDVLLPLSKEIKVSGKASHSELLLTKSDWDHTIKGHTRKRFEPGSRPKGSKSTVWDGIPPDTYGTPQEYMEFLQEAMKSPKVANGIEEAIELGKSGELLLEGIWSKGKEFRMGINLDNMNITTFHAKEPGAGFSIELL
jgi:hypothetical protein